MRLIDRLALMLLCTAAASAAAQTPTTLQVQVEAALARAPSGTRIGLVVTDDSGHEIVSLLPDQRFMPASNTKLVTTAAAFDWPSLEREGLIVDGARVWLTAGDVVVAGYGDARLSSALTCRIDCLATLADAVAAKTKRVGDVIGDASWFADMRWSGGMSWNNIPTDSGTAIAALSLDDNEVALVVSPSVPNQPPKIDVNAYYTIDNRALTVENGPAKLGYDRLPLTRTVRLTGTIAAKAEPERFRLGIDDPAHFAAWTLAQQLAARGVKVTGRIKTRYRPVDEPDRFELGPPPLAALDAPPLSQDLTIINKFSQNLHAELLWRQMGRDTGNSAPAGSIAVVHGVLAKAGLPRAAYDLADGSGMSTYNRISPRGMAMLLRWGARQPWGPQWRATLPVGGVDGTLASRFKGTALEGHIFAKTGALNGTTALSGYMTAKSGRMLTFALLANDSPDGTDARPTMDAALVLIAERN